MAVIMIPTLAPALKRPVAKLRSLRRKAIPLPVLIADGKLPRLADTEKETRPRRFPVTV